MNTDLSIVIPAYNVEKYLCVCLDSLLANERICDAEIIIVNDGSSDNTLSVAQEYSKNFQNIKVISTANGGPAAARNLGLNEAAGKYVFFCDADDIVIDSFLSIILGVIWKYETDVVLWCAEIIDESGKVIAAEYRDYFCYKGIKDGSRIYSGHDLMKNQLSACGDYPSVIWLGAYRREYLLQKNLLFKDGIHHEDDLWVPLSILEAETVIYIPDRLYLYRQRKDSLSKPSGDHTNDYIESLLFIYPHLFKYSEDNYKNDPLLPLLESCLTRKYLHWIYRYRLYKGDYCNRIDKKLLWRTSGRFKDRIRVLFLFVIGLFY